MSLTAQKVQLRASATAAKAMLEDIGVLTGGQAIFEETGIKLEGVQLKDLVAAPSASP